MRYSVRVLPRSSKNSISKNSDGSLRVHLTEAPVDGKANRSLVRLLSEYFDVPKKNISVVNGENSRNKIIEVLN